MQPAGRSRAHRRWILGRYVQLTSLLQLLVYGTAVFARDPTPVLRSFDPRSGAHALDVEDPYYGGHDDFEDVFTVIDASLPGLHKWVDEQLTARGIAS